MSSPTFLAVVDVVPAVADQFVVCLGRPANPDAAAALPEGRALVFERVDAAALAAIARLDPRRMAGGLVVVTARAEHDRDAVAVLRAQKLLALRYVKFVDMPSHSTRIPDPCGLRGGKTPPEYLHFLNMWRNTPLHLRCPLVDKLAAERVGLPCLLLLPGPSLAGIADALPELARRNLVVTISRVLPLLRARGVVPDVLVQLDTLPMQEQFHHPDERFPESVLLSLSSAPVAHFAPRFRRTFFIDSFNLALLPNPARLRESWLSSLLACLGAVEALAAPRALVAGADLRLLPGATYCDEVGAGRDGSEFPPYAGPLAAQNGRVTFADAAGRRAETSLQFFAAAAEAELFARDIGRTRGTAFRNLSTISVLDRRTFAPIGLRAALAAPPVDRRLFWEKADRAAAAREPVRLEDMRERYATDFAGLRRDSDMLDCLSFADPAGAVRHPFYAYVARNLPWFRPADGAGVLRCARNLGHELCAAARFARNVAALACRAAAGKDLPVLCTAEEEAGVLARLAAFAPGVRFRGVGLRTLARGRSDPTGGAVGLEGLDAWLGRLDAVLLAPGCAREFHYVLALLDRENFLFVEDVLAYGSACTPREACAPCGNPS